MLEGAQRKDPGPPVGVLLRPARRAATASRPSRDRSESVAALRAGIPRGCGSEEGGRRAGRAAGPSRSGRSPQDPARSRRQQGRAARRMVGDDHPGEPHVAPLLREPRTTPATLPIPTCRSAKKQTRRAVTRRARECGRAPRPGPAVPLLLCPRQIEDIARTLHAARKGRLAGAIREACNKPRNPGSPLGVRPRTSACEGRRPWSRDGGATVFRRIETPPRRRMPEDAALEPAVGEVHRAPGASVRSAAWSVCARWLKRSGLRGGGGARPARRPRRPERGVEPPCGEQLGARHEAFPVQNWRKVGWSRRGAWPHTALEHRLLQATSGKRVAGKRAKRAYDGGAWVLRVFAKMLIESPGAGSTFSSSRKSRMSARAACTPACAQRRVRVRLSRRAAPKGKRASRQEICRPVVDPSSTTITSNPARVWAARPARTLPSLSRRWYVGMTTLAAS